MPRTPTTAPVPWPSPPDGGVANVGGAPVQIPVVSAVDRGQTLLSVVADARWQRARGWWRDRHRPFPIGARRRRGCVDGRARGGSTGGGAAAGRDGVTRADFGMADAFERFR